jgi:4'-phosphopantetheinyl transferase EntD
MNSEPAEWSNDIINKYLTTIKNHCMELSIVELDKINNSAEKMLTAQELIRFKKMGERRKKSYIGARLTCKYLFKKLAGSGISAPANAINTVFADLPYPQCPFPDELNPYNCSVSHDSKFAIAVASKRKIGVDVEEISERALKVFDRFMYESEMSIVKTSGLGGSEAAVRVWSIKEAVTKALRINMYQSWKIARVTEIGQNRSSLNINSEKFSAYHDIIDEHLFTVVELD